MASGTMTESASSPAAPAFSAGRDDLEYTTELDMRMVCGTTTSILPGVTGFNSHYQLRDNFVISSVDPNFAYMHSGRPTGGTQVICVNLTTGEFRTCGQLWKIPGGVHCMTTGFGFIAVVTSDHIFIAEETNWNHYWSRDSLGAMNNSCVLTKLLESDEGLPEEIVLIVGSNGGSITTLAIPKVPEPEYMLMDAEDTSSDSGVDQTDVPPGKVRVLKFVEKAPIEAKQFLCRTGPALSFPRISNVNCIVQGKGIYTDYIVAAPDWETRLLIFARQYEYKEVGVLEDYRRSTPIPDAKLSIFELIEQQRPKTSILLPLLPPRASESATSPKATLLLDQVIDSSDESSDDSYSEDFDGRRSVNSLNLAWAPWHNRSILAAGTDSKDLIVYNFDAVQALLVENGPEHIFSPQESEETVLFRRKFPEEVRLLKFSPLPSVPILAVATMNRRIYFFDCNDFSMEWVEIPAVTTGMAWTRDASALLVATARGCVRIKVKKLPSLTDQIIFQLSQSQHALDNLDVDVEGIEDIKERLNLASFGYVLKDDSKGENTEKAKKVSWNDEDWVNPPLRLKSGPGPINPLLSNIGPRPLRFGLAHGPINGEPNNDDGLPVFILGGQPPALGDGPDHGRHIVGRRLGFLGNAILQPIQIHVPAANEDQNEEPLNLQFPDGPEPTED